MGVMNKRKLYLILTIVIVALLPSAVFASVIIDQNYSISATAADNPVCITTGPNYATAHNLKFITLTNGSSVGAVNSTHNTITIGQVANDSNIELINVMEIKESHTVTSDTVVVTLTINSTSGIAIYYSTSLATAAHPGTALTTTPTPITLSSSTPIIYLSTELTGAVNTPVELTTTYTVS